MCVSQFLLTHFFIILLYSEEFWNIYMLCIIWLPLFTFLTHPFLINNLSFLLLIWNVTSYGISTCICSNVNKSSLSLALYSCCYLYSSLCLCHITINMNIFLYLCYLLLPLLQPFMTFTHCASNCPQLKDQSPCCLHMKKARSTQGKVTCFSTTQGSKTQLAGYSFRWAQHSCSVSVPGFS